MEGAKPNALTSTWLARGRGAGINPPNRYDGLRLDVMGDHLDALRRAQPGGAQVATEIIPDRSRSIINHVDSADLPFHWTINPYRGCEHGCAYCYARPTHELLGYSCGVDFETRILAKFDAADLLQRELADPRWTPEPIVMSGVTDPYQPIERDLLITRHILSVMSQTRQPVSLITKNRMITRDLDVLGPLIEAGAVRAAISVTTLETRLSRLMEPRASGPASRLKAIAELAEAGVPVAVMVAPVIPGLNDHEIPSILEAAADAGANSANWVLLRLPHQVKDVFLDWLKRELPERAGRVESLIRQMHNGDLYHSRFGQRQRGHGALAVGIKTTFDVFQRRFGLDGAMPALRCDAFRRPRLDGQMELFSESV